MVICPLTPLSPRRAVVSAGATRVCGRTSRHEHLPRCVEATITERTKAIMPVHLTGRILRYGAPKRDRGSA